MEDLIANDAMIVTLSHRGYIKRTLSSEFRVQGRGGKGLKGMETRGTKKDEAADFIEHLFSVQAHDYLLFFTNTGRMYVERVYQLPEGSRTATGRSIQNVLNLQPEEKIAALLRLERKVDDDGTDITFREDAGFVFFGTRTGKVKKTPLNDFRNYRQAGLNAIVLEAGNELIGVRLTSGSDNILLVTYKGMSVHFDENDARSQGRVSMGVRGIRIAEDDYVVGLAVATSGATLLIASENGIGKRSPFEDYRKTFRGGKGVKAMNVTEKSGPLIGAVTVTEEDELMLMTSSGQSIRIRVSDIRETGRVTQGVKLLTLKNGEKLQDISIIIPDGEDADGATTTDGEDEPSTDEPTE